MKKLMALYEQNMSDITVTPREPESNSVGPENDFDATIPMSLDTTSVPAPTNVDVFDNPVDQEDLLTKVLEPFSGQVYGELGAIVGVLEGLSVLLQTFHWRVNGNSFYGDHLLFQRIYEGIDEQIDGIAEKAVGLGSVNLVDPSKVSEVMDIFLNHVNENSPSIATDDSNLNFAYAKKAKYALEIFVHMVEKMMEDMKDKNTLTKGLDNLLAGVLDIEEGFIYLLKQRVLVGA